jgi:hypothetical protein
VPRRGLLRPFGEPGPFGIIEHCPTVGIQIAGAARIDHDDASVPQIAYVTPARRLGFTVSAEREVSQHLFSFRTVGCAPDGAVEVVLGELVW